MPQNITASASSISQTTETPANTNFPVFAIGPTKYTASFSHGAIADQVQQTYYGTLSLAAAAQTINLNSLTDPLGNAVNFTVVRRFRIRNNSTTDGQICTVAPGAVNPWLSLLGTATSTLIVQPSSALNNGWVEFVSPNTTGWAVSGTNCSVSFNPGANTFGVDIEIVGI